MNSAAQMTGDRIPWLRAGFSALVVGMLAMVLFAEPTNFLSDVGYYGLMFGSAVAVLVRVAVIPEARLAWTLIAVGVAAWAAGDVYYDAVLVDQRPVPYPSFADALYFSMYPALLVGLLILRGRGAGLSFVSSGLFVSMLGLVTIWSWLVFGHVIDTAEGGTAAVATTIAYPALDLALLLTTLFAFAGRDWKFDWVFGSLALGFALLAVADSIFAVQSPEGTYVEGGIVDTLWPAGAAAIAFAAWSRPGPTRERMAPERLLPVFAALAIVLAIVVLVLDHFDRVDTATVVLSAATLGFACGQLLLVHRERTEARSRADAAEAVRSASTEAALDCVITIDASGSVREWNEAAERTFGYSREDVSGRELAELIIPPDQREEHRSGLARLARTGERPRVARRIEVMAMHAGGSTFPIELAITQVRDEPALYTGFARDISARRKREEENERLAAIVRSSEDAIISIDRSGVVTTWNRGAEAMYGYEASEAIGRPVSTLIVPPSRLKQHKEIVQRVLAGEQVGLETQRQNREGAVIDVSLRLLPMRDLGGEIVGVTATAHDVTEKRRRAERERRDREGRMWRTRVRDALADGRLVFWGQPVIDPLTGRVDHHELLVRMELDDEVISPGRFLPHAERSELMTEVDRWAIREGARVAARIPVAINLSARSLGNAVVLEEIKRRMAEPRIAPNVTFEITETAAAENLLAAGELVEELISLGCGVALDDFGTGYGSFTYLKHLPVTELKIDIQFIRGIVHDLADRRVVSSIVATAQNFDMKTVAEGVEDEATLQLLRTMHVDLVQGYYTGRPAPMDPDAYLPPQNGRVGAHRGRFAV